jgi:hypothetical protein
MTSLVEKHGIDPNSLVEIREKTARTNTEWVGMISHETGKLIILIQGKTFTTTRPIADLMSVDWEPGDLLIHSHIPESGEWTHTILHDVYFLASQEMFNQSAIVENERLIILQQGSDFEPTPLNVEEADSLYYFIGTKLVHDKNIEINQAEYMAIVYLAAVLGIEIYSSDANNALIKQELIPQHKTLLKSFLGSDELLDKTLPGHDFGNR